MNTARAIAATFKAKDTLEGAGVHLKRGFSNREASRFDPFLLFDDFSSTIPEHYLAGFPWHPHRGMETVTYILDGAVRHKDSLGNEGVIENGAIQWMTAGSGIIHEEMPESVHGIRGFQLWVNLPKKAKMASPRYQDLKGATVPEVALGGEARARVIAGALAGVAGPLTAIAGNPLYADITLAANGSVSIPLVPGHTAFAYVVEGALGTDAAEPTYFAPGTILLFEREGDEVALRAPAAGARFLLISGAPLGEPIAWHGPIVMNTDEELREAFRDLNEGNFIRTHQ
ncbi:MAG: pirin family protein [Candidatus Kaiserbacteria bacterium]|nr:pirin family protein [Candidatus Kaiserbacteria bacterium]